MTSLYGCPGAIYASRSFLIWYTKALRITVLRHIFVHMDFVASVFEAIYFMFKSYYMGGNLYQKKAL